MGRTRRTLLVAVASLALGVASAALAGREEDLSPEALTNFRLGPQYAQWLVGPVARIADAEERGAYLALADDAAAAAFIAAFWQGRGGVQRFPPSPGWTFQQRAAEADVLYREGTHLGHRTDRGTLHVLYRPPAEVRFDPSPTPGGEPLETWLYAKDAPPGLDGKQPKRLYQFRKEAGVTRSWVAPVRRRNLVDGGR